MFHLLGLLLNLIANLLPLYIIYIVWKIILDKSGKSSPFKYLLDQIQSARTDYLLPDDLDQVEKAKDEGSEVIQVTDPINFQEEVSLNELETSPINTFEEKTINHPGRLKVQASRPKEQKLGWKQAIIYKEILDKPLGLRDRL